MAEKTRVSHFVDAIISVATVNHYMVGIVEFITDDELDAAEQELIKIENTRPTPTIALALDLIEAERNARMRAGKEVFQNLFFHNPNRMLMI
jgi:DNA-binding XRE family transcriptional regulator